MMSNCERNSLVLYAAKLDIQDIHEIIKRINGYLELHDLDDETLGYIMDSMEEIAAICYGLSESLSA